MTTHAIMFHVKQARHNGAPTGFQLAFAGELWGSKGGCAELIECSRCRAVLRKAAPRSGPRASEGLGIRFGSTPSAHLRRSWSVSLATIPVGGWGLGVGGWGLGVGASVQRRESCGRAPADQSFTLLCKRNSVVRVVPAQTMPSMETEPFSAVSCIAWKLSSSHGQ
jgi:hypothetical protein